MIAEAGAGIVTTVRFSGRGQEPEMIGEPISRFWFTEEVGHDDHALTDSWELRVP